jgi:hypothetical protein
MSDGDSLFTKKSGRSEAKDANGASFPDAKLGAKMALNEMDESPDDGGSGEKGGGASPPPPRASVGWGSDAGELASDQKDKDGAVAAGESKRVGRRRKGSDAGTGSSGTAAGGKFAKNRHFDDDGESTGGCILLMRR